MIRLSLPPLVSSPLLVGGLYLATLATCLGCPALAMVGGSVAALSAALMGVA